MIIITMAHMSYDVFLENIFQFVNMSDKFGDVWKLKCEMGENNVYLKKEILRKSNTSASLNPNDFDTYHSETLFWEYHIVYSYSYGVPLLCLNIRNIVGEKKKFTVEDVWRLINSNYKSENMHSVLTEQDHPVLQTPVLMLHPCKTHELLEHLLKVSKNPLVSWLSAIGPAVHLEVDGGYEILTRN